MIILIKMQKIVFTEQCSYVTKNICYTKIFVKKKNIGIQKALLIF